MGRAPNCRNGHPYPPDAPVDHRGTRVCQLCAQRGLCKHCQLRPPSRPGHPYCSKACSNASRARPLAERFIDYYREGPPTECWPWLGTVDRNGYGVITIGPSRQLRAHRVAYERSYGPLTQGQYVLHSCDNPPCCNPAHLRTGTQDDNRIDMMAKGRQSRGEKHTRSKLTESAVRAIRAALQAKTPMATIAMQFDVSPAAIYMIRNGRTWKHIS